MTTADRPPLPLRLLSRLHGAAGDRVGRRLLAGLGVRRLSRAWLRRRVLPDAFEGPDDVTVLLGVRDRADHRIVNALASLAAQRCPGGTVRTLVVDWGSGEDAARFVEEACREHGADYLRVAGPDTWSRSRCLNVGIRRAETKYLLTADADLVFSPDYVADAVDLLRREPLSVVCAPMHDLPEESTEAAKRTARQGEPFPIDAWRDRATRRLDWDRHPSIGLAHTAFYQLIRGYDEFYEGWGWEDLDLFDRLVRLGLEARTLETDSLYLHQWHEKHEHLPRGADSDVIERNEARYRATRSIVRNGPWWGRADGTAGG